MTSVDRPASMEEVVGQARLRIEAVAADKPKTDVAAEEEGGSQSELGREQLLSVQVRLVLPPIGLSMDHEEATHLVLVVDKSGSMSGTPWKQVQDSLKDLIRHSIELPNVKTDLIVYDDKAHHIMFKPTDYVNVIDSIKASNATNFKKAFEKIVTVVTDQDTSVSRTVVVFMTDGQDTCNSGLSVTSLTGKLAETFRDLGKETCVHTVGFTSGHNFSFLQQLAQSGGTTPGMFRYCEPGENTLSLQQKLYELFDFLLHNTSHPAQIHVTMLGTKGHFIAENQQDRTVALEGQTEWDQEHGELEITGETWVKIEDPLDIPEFEVVVETNITQNKEVKNILVPCISGKPELKVIESADEKVAWRLKILTRNVEDLVTRTASAIADKADVSSFQKKVERYQEKITHTRVFGNGITKETRENMFTAIKDTQASLDKIQGMLAEYLRSGTGSISLLARAHDMRYQAVFSKNRRQRVMDKRAAKNMQHAQADQDSLTSLTVDQQEVRSLSQDALHFYFCVLSQDSVQDVLLGDDKTDAIGFGLAVKRSEVVLDEPTLIRLQVISGTLVSRSAMLDALEYKINVSSHLSAHGGFSFQDGSLGVTTVGTGREPINAWLPLYITKSHWGRVKVILKPALGSFCTLDPLGYHYKQLDVLFAVLGSMIGQLTDQNVGEHRLRLLFAVQRTCTACLEDFDLLDSVKETVKNFLASPAGRTKDIIANLYTLIGYIVAMPTEAANEIFDNGEEGNHLSGFWVGYIAELARRASGSLHHDTGSHMINGIVHALLHGKGSQTKKIPYSQALSALVAMCQDTSTDYLDLKLDIQPFDPSTEVKCPSPANKHDPKVDKAMELWAKGKTGYLKNLAKNKKYKEASKIVQKWLKEVSTVSKDEPSNVAETDCLGEAVGDEEVDIDAISDDDQENEEVNAPDDDDDDHKPDDGTDVKTAADSGAATREDIDTGSGKHEEKAEYDAAEREFDCQNITTYMLQVMAQMHNKICRAAFPGIQSLPGCMAFVNHWLSRQHDICDLDSNSGLPPQEWVEDIRKAVTEVFRQLRDFEQASLAQTAVYAEEKIVQGTSELSVEAGTQLAQDQGTTAAGDVHVPQETVAVQEKQDNEEGNNFDDDDDAYGGYIDDDDDDDDDGYEVDGDDSYTDASRRQEARKQKKATRRCEFTLPTILQYLEKNQDTMLLLRAIMCQAVSFHSNSSARAAITNKSLLDLKGGVEARATTLCEFARFLQELRKKLIVSMFERVMWQQANFCMLHATSTWAFVGYLMNTHKSRLEGFSELVDQFMSMQTDRQTLPCLQEKVHILLTGKYQDLPVLDNGNQWLPEKKMAAKFKALLGPEVWMDFEVELHSSVQIHVYRASDIPNRHGHCNSNPYIPNCLRAKLGMKLLPTGRRKHRH